jgi:MFS family permease
VGFPFYGYIIDAVGRYSKLIIVAISGVMAAHFLLTFTFINPFVGVILMAVSYSLLSTSLWPMIALIVPKHQLGTAYGMYSSF